MRVIVCGGRDYDDHDTLCNTMSSLQSMYDLKVATGGCSTGADAMAHEWATQNCETPPKVYFAAWRTLGLRAGPIRNQRMLEDFGPDLVVAFHGGKGTADMVQKAIAAGVTVIQVGKSFPL